MTKNSKTGYKLFLGMKSIAKMLVHIGARTRRYGKQALGAFIASVPERSTLFARRACPRRSGQNTVKWRDDHLDRASVRPSYPQMSSLPRPDAPTLSALEKYYASAWQPSA